VCVCTCVCVCVRERGSVLRGPATLCVQTRHLNTGGRRPIGCLKLQVIFRKKATNYRAFLRMITYTDKASYGSLPPCSVNSIMQLSHIHIWIYTHAYIHTPNIHTCLHTHTPTYSETQAPGMQRSALSYKCRTRMYE